MNKPKSKPEYSFELDIDPNDRQFLASIVESSLERKNASVVNKSNRRTMFDSPYASVDFSNKDSLVPAPAATKPHSISTQARL
jgi:hypothetical protein